MATFYVKTTGNAANSGCSDGDSPLLSGTAVTGLGTTTLTLDGSPNLSALVTAAGATQSTIYVNNATNTNRKIFKITAFNDGLDQVTVDVAPTGSDSGSWRIGGRHIWTPATIEASVFAGDIIEIGDSIAASATDVITCRNNGDSAGGFIKLIGKTGVRPVITCTSTPQCIEGASQTLWWVENLELVQQGASGSAIGAVGTGWVFKNIKVTDAGGAGISLPGAAARVIDSEFSGCGTAGVSVGASGVQILGCHIHDNTLIGVEVTPTSPICSISNNIIAENGGRGIALTGFPTTTANNCVIEGNTVYANGDSNLEVVDADHQVTLTNNIFHQTGAPANVEFTGGVAEKNSYHSHNVFHHAGGGGTNLINLTVNATEATTDPLLTNPGSGDFTISAASPAAGAGYPGAFLGSSTGYRDIGAVQRQVTAGGGGRVIGS